MDGCSLLRLATRVSLWKERFSCSDASLAENRPMKFWGCVLVFLMALESAVMAQTNNDSFAGRLTLSGLAVSALSDNTTATKEPGEPNHASLSGGRSLWWTWTAPSTGVVNFSIFGSVGTNTSALGYDFPSNALAVYTGSAFSNLSEAGSSNNQPLTFLEPVTSQISTGPSFNLSVSAGTTYQIAFDSSSASSPVVININQVPTIVSGMASMARAGSAFSYSVQASNSPTSYAATGLPSGLSINSSSGLISGTPSVTGTYTVGISATNPAGTGAASLTLTILSTTSTVALQRFLALLLRQESSVDHFHTPSPATARPRVMPSADCRWD